jgi:hypothetical protein
MPGPTGATIRIISNRLPDLSPELHKLVADEVQRSAFDVQSRAQQVVPVLTGTLRRSIHTLMSNGGLTATVGPSVGYGFWVEFGSRGRAPRPYMRPAAEYVASRFLERIKAILKGLH